MYEDRIDPYSNAPPCAVLNASQLKQAHSTRTFHILTTGLISSVVIKFFNKSKIKIYQPIYRKSPSNRTQDTTMLPLFCCIPFNISDTWFLLLFWNYFQPDFRSCYDSVLLGNLHQTINRGKTTISILFRNSSTFTQNMLNVECSSPGSGCSLTNCCSLALASHPNSQYKYGQPCLLKDFHT